MWFDVLFPFYSAQAVRCCFVSDNHDQTSDAIWLSQHIL